MHGTSATHCIVTQISWQKTTDVMKTHYSLPQLSNVASFQFHKLNLFKADQASLPSPHDAPDQTSTLFIFSLEHYTT